jgi:hypothetical protein
MGTGRPRLDFSGLRQIFKFEVSRFPFAPEERQPALRRAYRELEAVLRHSIWELELDWGDPRRMPPRLLQTRLGNILRDLQDARGEYGRLLSPEMQGALETLCGYVQELRECVLAARPEVGGALREFIRGLDELKRILGTVHRL